MENIFGSSHCSCCYDNGTIRGLVRDKRLVIRDWRRWLFLKKGGGGSKVTITSLLSIWIYVDILKGAPTGN